MPSSPTTSPSCCILEESHTDMSVTIASITGENITDSRGVPTLCVTVHASDGTSACFAVPSGASTGSHEVHELRDDGTNHGAVTQALAFLVGEIAPALAGKDIFAQKEIDMQLRILDGTQNKSRLGGNTLIGVSIALAKTAAKSQGREVWEYLHDLYFPERAVTFPRLYANLISGGKQAATKLAFQEYLIVPKTTIMKDALSLIFTIQEKLHDVVKERYGTVEKGDEGGFALPLVDVEEPLSLLNETASLLGVRDQVDFAVDVSASSFFDTESGQYSIDGLHYDAYALMALYENVASTYDLLSIEDPFYEEDFVSFTNLKPQIGETLLVGDDLTTTNKERLLLAIQKGSVDALLIKPNQIGTLTETIETMQCAHENGIECIVSQRSGETVDDFIVDLAYASGAFGLKAGARGPREREVKFARLLAIENAL